MYMYIYYMCMCIYLTSLYIDLHSTYNLYTSHIYILYAQTDCSCALAIDRSHIKSYLRRAKARNALCKHRAAFSDLSQVLELDPDKLVMYSIVKYYLQLYTNLLY